MKPDAKQLIVDLWARQFTAEQIAHSLGVTGHYVRQILRLLHLSDSRFETSGEALTWLASEEPSLEAKVREFRNGTQAQAPEQQAA